MSSSMCQHQYPHPHGRDNDEGKEEGKMATEEKGMKEGFITSINSYCTGAPAKSSSSPLVMGLSCLPGS
jgi:hypothetical protein